MTQAILKPNEFIVGIEDNGDEMRMIVRNPHTEIGQSGDYDHTMLLYLCSYLEAAAKLKYRPKTLPESLEHESDPELYD